MFACSTAAFRNEDTHMKTTFKIVAVLPLLIAIGYGLYASCFAPYDEAEHDIRFTQCMNHDNIQSCYDFLRITYYSDEKLEEFEKTDTPDWLVDTTEERWLVKEKLDTIHTETKQAVQAYKLTRKPYEEMNEK